TSLIGIGVLATLAFSWRLFALSGLTLLLPAILGWMYWDARIVRLWTLRVLKICTDSALDVSVFAATIRSMRHLPQTTIGSMLSELDKAQSKQSKALTKQRMLAQLSDAERSYLVPTLISLIGCIGIFAGWWLESGILQASSWVIWLTCPWTSSLTPSSHLVDQSKMPIA
ncbi:MAG TPA: hypothetical protein VM260_26560, partial [Pirellula sp.]|nr:hypothetical protein [Pirellula sp.]